MKYTKKYIREVIRTMNRTAIFALYAKMHKGEKVDRVKVCDMIHEYAPTQAISRKAYDIAFGHYEKSCLLSRCEKWDKFFKDNPRHVTLAMFRDEISSPLNPYTKRPIMGHTHLYFASPVYGHSDYNKCRMLEIRGNERFCELLVKLADKYFGKFE